MPQPSELNLSPKSGTRRSTLIAAVAWLILRNVGPAFSAPSVGFQYQPDGCILVDSATIAAVAAQRDEATWIHLSYPRFEVYVDSTYYAHNTPSIDTFCDHMSIRYELLESITLWKCEDLGGSFEDTTRLRVYIRATSNCFAGFAWPGEANVYLSDPIYKPLCEQATYYDGIPQFGNPSPFGDWWGSMGVAVHEMVHATHPLAFYQRRWLAEGWARYYELNLLSTAGDVNQETADHYILTGRRDYYWDGYLANDYHDTSPGRYEIQSSFGYDITAWMISMFRDQFSIDVSRFHEMLGSNRETVRGASGAALRPAYKVDACVLDFLGRAAGLDYETGIKPIFRYDGPQGPGWGVRHWEPLDWYADLTPTLKVSNCAPESGETIDLMAVVSNAGLVNIKGVAVRFYADSTVVGEAYVDVDSLASAHVSALFAAPAGDYLLSVRVDPDNLKVETNDANNAASVTVAFTNCGPTDTDGDCVADLCDHCVRYATPGNSAILTGDVNVDSEITVTDVLYLVNYVFKSGASPVPIPEAGDVNCDGREDSADLVRLSRHVFLGGVPPCDVCNGI